MRLLNTNSIDGLRAIAVLHIVLGHHSAYTGYIERNAPSEAAAPEADADEADAFGCSPKWCTSSGATAGSTDCWAGSGFEGCTCALGEARTTGQVFDGGDYGTYYEYECCLPSTNYSDLVGVACGSFIPPPAQLSPDDPMHRTTSGLDLVGGASMGLFYIISGFVLMLGYGSARSVPRGTECTDCCGDGTSANAGCCFPCFCAPTKEVAPARTAPPTVIVACPAGSGPGSSVHVHFEGKTFDAVVPAGVVAGQTFQVTLPASEAAVQVIEAAPAEAPLPPLSARDFYIKRFARLGPLWYLGNLLAVPLYFTGHTHATGAWWWAGFTLSLLPFGLNSWTILFFPPAGHLWTISTMTFFYLLFPTIATHLNRVHPKQVRSLVCALYVIQIGLFVFMLIGASIFVPLLAEVVGAQDGLAQDGLGYWWARAWPPIRLPTFVMGMLAARQAELEAKDPALSQNCVFGRTSQGGPHYATALLLVWLLIVVLGILEQLFLTSAGLGYLCRVYGEAALPILFYELIVALSYPASAAKPPSTTHAFLGSKPLRLFADISLAVYVVHQTLIVYMTFAAYGVLWPGAFATDGALILMPKWGAAATLPLSIVLGWLLTYGFERPMSRAIRRCVSAPAATRQAGV